MLRAPITVLRTQFDFPVYPDPAKIAKVTQQTKALISAKAVTKREWQSVLGKLIWLATLNRPLLSCLQRVFHIADGLEQDDYFEIDEIARREMWMIASLLPLARVNLQLPIATVLVAFDASLTAGALVYTFITPRLASEIWYQGQSARFDKGQRNDVVLPAVQEAVEGHKWVNGFIHKWSRAEHINGLEAAAAVMSLEWGTRKGLEKTSFLILTDSLVVLGALRKGRSSSSPLLARCRRFGALAMAHEIRPVLAYVRSEDNPADKYTRIEDAG